MPAKSVARPRLAPAKAELAGRLFAAGERIKASAKFLQPAVPARCLALLRLQENFRGNCAKEHGRAGNRACGVGGNRAPAVRTARQESFAAGLWRKRPHRGAQSQARSAPSPSAGLCKPSSAARRSKRHAEEIETSRRRGSGKTRAWVTERFAGAGGVACRGVEASQAGRLTERKRSTFRFSRSSPTISTAANCWAPFSCSGATTQSAAAYRAGAQRSPDNVFVLNNHGIALERLERFQEALASLDRAIVLRPEYAEATFQQG